MPDAQHILTIDDERVLNFVDRVGPQIRDYLGHKPGCVAPIGSGGKPYGIRLYVYLFDQGEEVNYTELEKGRGITAEQRPIVEGRRLIIVDDGITTGDTYRKDMATLRDKKDEFGIVDVVVAVEHDMRGLANFAANRNGDRPPEVQPDLPLR